MTQAKAKSNSVVTTEWSGDILSLSVLGAGTLMFDRTRCSAANRDRAEQHGWTQRLCDRMAKKAPVRVVGQADAAWEASKAAFTQAKYDSVKVIIEYYESGEVAWKMSGGGATEGGMLFEALCELYADKRSAEQIREFLDTRTDEQLKVVRKVPALVDIMNRLRAERAGQVDVEEALGDLDEMDEVTVDEEVSQLMTDE
jgi:hypothetical protein